MDTTKMRQNVNRYQHYHHTTTMLRALLRATETPKIMVQWKNVFYTIGALFLLCFVVPIKIEAPVNLSENNISIVFNNFIEKYNKTYNNNDTLRLKKYNDFQTNLKEIQSLNKFRTYKLSASFGVTKFSDMSKEEFSKHYLRDGIYKKYITNSLKVKLKNYDESHEDQSNEIKIQKRSVDNLPMKVDWRDKGVISDVNNQKYCGACWAFSTVQTIESMKAMKDNVLQKLSVQQLIDCAGYNNNGCEGGDICTLLYWLYENKIPVVMDKLYPLHLKTESCKMKTNITGVQVSDFDCYNLVDDEDRILELLATHGPVAVAVNALMWQNYLGGVIHFHCSGSPMMLNHAVQIVGYDRTAEIPFYIVRNSWGKDFGDKGYLYLGIGSNVCGVANEVTTVDVL